MSPRILSLTAFSFLPISLAAQQLLPPDVGAFGFGRPGIGTEFGTSGASDGDAGSLDSTWLSLNLPLYKWDVGSGILAAGVSYNFQQLEWTAADDQGIDFSADLHRAGLRLTWADFPKNKEPGWFSLAQLSLTQGGTSDDFGSSDPDGAALAVVGWQFSQEFSFAGAFYARYQAGEATIFPGIGLVWRPSDQWLFFLSPPAPSITYAIAEDWRISAAIWPQGGRWTLDGTENGVTDVEQTGFRGGLTLEHDVTKKFSVSVRGGLNFGQELSLRDGQSRPLAEGDLDNAWFGAVGLQWNF